MKRCKTHICKGSGTHFGSLGYYASSKNKSDYKIINKLLVITYANKNTKHIYCQTDINKISLNLKNMRVDELRAPSQNFEGRILRINMLMCLLLNVAYMEDKK